MLDGAPAICMAVNRRARVTISATDAVRHTVTAPGFIDRTTQFSDANGALRWDRDEDALELLDRLWQASAMHSDSSLALTLDTAAFVHETRGCKTGIGSSAALAVALAAAFGAFRAGGPEPLAAAQQGHLEFQNGLGSGVDVATSWVGGIVRYTMAGEAAASLDMPAGLVCRVIWSGAAAATGKKLAHYGSAGLHPSKAALACASQRMADAWQSGASTKVLEEYRDYVNVLREFSADHGLGIFDAGHAEVAARASEFGLVYKPCGAGGGDIGMVIADDLEAVDAFVADALPAPFEPMDLQLDPRGVQVVSKAP